MKKQIDFDDLIKKFKDKMEVNVDIELNHKDAFKNTYLQSIVEPSYEMKLFIGNKSARIQLNDTTLPKGHMKLAITNVDVDEWGEELLKILYQFIYHLISYLESEEKEFGRKLISVGISDEALQESLKREVDNSLLEIPYLNDSFFYYFDIKERRQVKEYFKKCKEKKDELLRIIRRHSDKVLFQPNFGAKSVEYSNYNPIIERFNLNFYIIYAGMVVYLNFSDSFEEKFGIQMHVTYGADLEDGISDADVYHIDTEDLENSLFNALEEIESDYALYLIVNPTVYQKIYNWVEMHFEMNINEKEFSNIIINTFKDDMKMKNYLLKIEREWDFKKQELMLNHTVLKFKSMEAGVDLAEYIAKVNSSNY